MKEEGPGDLGAQEGGHQEHGGKDQAELAGLLLPQQHEPIDNLFEGPFINFCGNSSFLDSLTSQSLDLQFLITTSITGADKTSGWTGVNVSLSSSFVGGTLMKILISAELDFIEGNV